MERLTSRLQKLKSKKGFTLIELLAVIAIIAILVLIAAPSFLGNKEKAQLAHIKADVKTAQLAVGRHLLDHETLAEKGEGTSKVGFPIYTYTKSEEVTPYNTKGKFEGDVNSGGTLYNVSSLIDSSLNKKGLFVGNDKGEVFYLANGKSNLGSNPGSGGEKEPDVKPEPNPETDFEWVSYSFGYTFPGQSGEGYWHYKGDSTEVVIPEKLGGHTLTSYNYMFEGTSVTKVTSTNKKVTEMRSMFLESQATSLDLSNFDTSNVTNMYGMFHQSKATTLDLSNFDTSNVTDMRSMFASSQADSLDLSKFNTANVTSMNGMFAESQANTLDLRSFNTSNVTNMGYMFAYSQATSLDLSGLDTSSVENMEKMFAKSKATTLDLRSFNTSNVTDMNSMFSDSQTTTGYARTSADADKFNSSLGKPTGLTFTAK